MEEIRIVDTTLRDGNTSLWAHNMTTGMMAPTLPHMDQAGIPRRLPRTAAIKNTGRLRRPVMGCMLVVLGAR